MSTLYASNDGRARYLGVSLYSLLERHRDTENITIYLLSISMSAESQGRFQGIAGQFGWGLAAAGIGGLREWFHGSVGIRGFGINIVTRLFAVDMLLETIDRILCLNYDTVILGSLKPLWRMEFGTTLVGMVPEPTIYEETEVSTDLERDAPYYSSGVLLMNLRG